MAAVSPKTSAPALALLFVAIAGCKASPPEPSPEPPATAAPTPANKPNDVHERVRAQRAAGGDQLPKMSPEPPKAPDDPLQGKFSLDDATKGLPAGKQILATIDTSMGKMECKLFDDKAPVTVANFVGLARGIRPWKTPEGTWEKKPAYDGTIFHRIIKGFMIQGGDAKKNGSGEAGYVIPDEVWAGATHDRAGLLCMANRGPNTNSAQFFITDAAALHLDKGYTIFGECGPLDVVHGIASVDVQGQRPKTPVDIKKITITRK
jgi:peptidyl-prolyl cis-trans isomerase A (cyclophilin A)